MKKTISLVLLLTILSSILFSIPVGAQEDGGLDVGVTLNTEVSGNVEFWHFWGSPLRRNAIRRVLAVCQQALPNITIEEVFKPFGEIWTANTAAVAAQSGMPDVIVSDRGQLPREAGDGIYQSLQPYIEAESFDSERFYPFTWEQAQYEGETYGIPFETDVRVLFYNKTLFEQAGLDPNAPPETWEEVLEAAEALDVVGEDGTIERLGFFPLFGNGGIDVWARTNGHQYVVDGAPQVNTPEFLETTEWVKTWVDRYGGWDAVQEFRASFGPAPNDAFMSGKVAMIMDIAGYASVLNFYNPRFVVEEGTDPVPLQWGIGLLPYNEASASWSGGFTLSIPNGAENPEAGWELIKCISSPVGQASWARDTYAVPSDIEAGQDPVLLADPNWQFIINAMETSQAATFVPGYPNYMEQFNQRAESIWRGDLEPAAALEEAQTAIDDTISANQ
jgi:multiple sugar transport system substrate-binding protein